MATLLGFASTWRRSREIKKGDGDVDSAAGGWTPRTVWTIYADELRRTVTRPAVRGTTINRHRFRGFGGRLIPALLLSVVAACGDHGSGGSHGVSPGGVTQRPTSSGATTATVAQKTIHQLPDGALLVSVLHGTGNAPVDGSNDAPVYQSAVGWYSFVVRPISQPGVAPAGSREVFVTHELPPLPLTDQNQILQRVDLQANGRSRAHRSGGVEVIVAIQGRIEIHSGTFSPTKLAVGEGVYVLDNTPLQSWSIGGQPASYLDYYLLPTGRATSSDEANSP